MVKSFKDGLRAQPASVERWSWLTPGLYLVLGGERRAVTDAQSHIDDLHQVDEYERRWREFLVPCVMDRQGLAPEDWHLLPRFLTTTTWAAGLPHQHPHAEKLVQFRSASHAPDQEASAVHGGKPCASSLL